jgi:DNA modification methylase
MNKPKAKVKSTAAEPRSARRMEYMLVEELAPALKNPKKHAERDLDLSVGRFGYTEPVLMDERTGRLVAGHGRVEALRRLQAKGDLPPEGVVDRGGKWLVPVVRGWSSRSDQEAEAYLLASNQLTVAGGWDNNSLVDMLGELEAAHALEGVGFSRDEISKLLDSVAAAAGDTVGDVDDAPEPSGNSWVQLGDMFELGDHRIICGDCTHAAVVDRLMGGEQARVCWTDPPWNVAYGENTNPAGWSKKHRAIANDNLGEDFPQFCALFCGEIARVCVPGAPLYMAMSAQEWGTIHNALVRMGFHWSSTVIWAKDSLVLSRKDYHTQYEPIWYGWREGSARLVELEDRTQSDLWQIARPKKSDEHPTMKPVELVVRSLKNSSRRGDLCFEPFSGSGTTLLACEVTGRRARAVELDPRYVQVALERWEKHTGRKAMKVT